ncbi:DNA polymerase III subunit beta [Tumebacillus permanentifrigoris]|uniref:Beta sliding clamp n=1 Tax=Tumebacillus permanentifrigoris TaxID=378543 RepID=A0A316DGG3_9BACL|nr:DNA polymerase III subunit beta [Tumebacillus permanentifrigoris]PWK16612.1 DNA polymerase III beta subunit [Tumebacillus permanentifrigoris]
MKIIILKNALVQAIQNVHKAVSSKSTIPVLSGIKMAADESGLRFTATDLEIGIETLVPTLIDDEEIVQVKEAGAIVLSARFFGEIVRKLPGKTVEIEVKQNYLTIIRSGKTEYNLHGLDHEEFPRLPQVAGNQVFSVQSDILKDMIRQTSLAVSSEEIRPVLTGVLFTLKNGNLKFVATDSHRLATRESIVEAPPEMEFTNVIVPGKSLNELGRLLADNDVLVDVVVAENQVLVKMGHTQFYTRLIDGQYPDISRIIPTTFKTGLTVNTKELQGAVERASLVAKESDNNVVRFNIKHDRLEITSASPDAGKMSEPIDEIQVNGDELLIAFNSKFFMDALRVIDSPDLLIEFTGSMSPFLIKLPDNPTYLHLILPVRIY